MAENANQAREQFLAVLSREPRARLTPLLATSLNPESGLKQAERSAPGGGEQPPKILLVDDHADTLQILSRLLRRVGYGVTTATGVRNALELAAEQRFDLLISDLGLPDGSGLEIMRNAKTLYPLHGIAISGLGTEEDIRLSLEAGFEEHVVKPISFEALRETIQRVVWKR
jgi:CheY-like chemotaxis protein